MVLAVSVQFAFSGTEGDERTAWQVALAQPTSILANGRDPLFAGVRGGRFYFGCGLFRLDAGSGRYQRTER